jgi:hypothetical protein
MGLAMSSSITGIQAGKMMSQQSTVTSRSAQSSIWQPIGAIGGAVILGIILPMIKGCQERSLISQTQPAAPTAMVTDDTSDVASTKR